LIGNRDYPNRKDIAPAHKNVRDIKEVLEYYEFKVRDYRDLDALGMARVLAEFGAELRTAGESALPGSVAVVFYFCGHGFQSAGRNYLVPAGVDPSSEKALSSSLRLNEDILVALPQRYPGISIALIDACRTDPMIRRGVDDFNQISLRQRACWCFLQLAPDVLPWRRSARPQYVFCRRLGRCAAGCERGYSDRRPFSNRSDRMSDASQV
jgi:hypothetical protein